LTKVAAITGGAAAAKLGLLGAEAKNSQPTPPNILFILVDEMRFPKVFPAGIATPDQFLQSFMPNTYKLWSSGVKFANHHTAATACTPARGVLVSGLYSQQTWCALTILDTPTTTIEPQPPLNPAFPTYGKLLRDAGYQTPYVGKWHLSIPRDNGLEDYGFDWLTVPADPTGVNLQGTYGDIQNKFLNDHQIADEAAAWLVKRKPKDQPWCLTVGFVNPHDKEFFPAGTEFKTFTDLFASQSQLAQWGSCPGGYSSSECVAQTNSSCAVVHTGVTWDQNALKDPPPLRYPPLPPNWESLDQLEATKPKFQTVVHEFMAMVWGGVTDDSTQTKFTIDPYPQASGKTYSPPYGIGTAPFNYWHRSLDSYTQILQIVDGNIGEVISALPKEVADNTIIMFTSDHGEYAGAHGFVSGKTGSFYDECVRVPLIVSDPTGRFTGDTDIIRTNLTSSVDFLPLIVSIGNNGSQAWIKDDDLRQLYKDRYDMLPILRSANAPGRQYVLFATDETTPSIYNFLQLPGGGYPGSHIVGMRTKDGKLGIYANWQPGTTDISYDSTLDVEFYDYSTPGGVAETDNRPNDPHSRGLYNRLVNDLIPHELQAPLPASLQPFQDASKARLIAYLQAIDNLTTDDWIAGAAGVNILGYGLNVP
jgi:uncharacterized sulfatase